MGQTAYLHCRVRNLGDRAVSNISFYCVNCVLHINFKPTRLFILLKIPSDLFCVLTYKKPPGLVIVNVTFCKAQITIEKFTAVLPALGT